MAYTTINKSSDYFNTVLYEGNGATGRGITGVGHQPDFVWIKNRDATTPHVLTDAVRGATVTLNSNDNSADDTISNGLTAFGTDGFTIGGNGSFNYNNESFVSWNWKAGTTSGLSGGTITPSSYSFSTISKFGIYKYTGNNTSGATVPHGLGAVPTLIMVKRTDTTGSWQVLGNGEGQPGPNSYGILNSQDGFASNANRWNNTAPTTSLFSLGNSAEVNASGGTYVAYVWCNVSGYFKAGLYQGNGNADGAFIYTGGKPSLILMRPNIAAKDWYLFDNKRDGYNSSLKFNYPNLNSAEGNISGYVDLFSNGFKVTTTDNSFNGLGNSYQFWCWMQTAVGSNNVPATAR
jgi:hypothetical protein